MIKKGLKKRSINDTTFLGGEGVKKPEKCMTKGGGRGFNQSTFMNGSTLILIAF